MSRPFLRIGLVLSYSQGYCRAILRGIKAYAEMKRRWVFTPVEPEPGDIEMLGTLEPAGLIAHAYNDELVAALTAFRRPLVNVSGVLADLPIPSVGSDDPMVGRLAAAHLLDRGFRHFGFAGQPSHAYSNRRESGFREVIEAAGFALSCYHERTTAPFDPRGRLWALDPEIQRWMRSLSKPVGVFVPNDMWGLQLTEVCRQMGLRVPEDVSLVGVDNDDLLCELARPSLSSVAVSADRIGFEAAGLLDRLMQRPRMRAPSRPILLPPAGVVTRRSSDVLAIRDVEVAAAVRFIREHAHVPFQVDDVLDAVPISRRSLERRFRAAIGRGVGEEIRRAHMERAKALLTGTDLPISEVATNAGFSEGKHLSVVFRQELGLTPLAYRRQFRNVVVERE